jgi:RNA polymerase sigma factor (sigma-70 family)
MARTDKRLQIGKEDVVLFSELGESDDVLFGTLQKQPGGRWDHHPERAGAESPEDRLLREEESEQLQKAVAKLPPRDRKLFFSRYGIEGPSRTLEALARARGCSTEAIRVRIEKIRNKLKRRLERQ